MTRPRVAGRTMTNWAPMSFRRPMFSRRDNVRRFILAVFCMTAAVVPALGQSQTTTQAQREAQARQREASSLEAQARQREASSLEAQARQREASSKASLADLIQAGNRKTALDRIRTGGA